jgi:branched-chain amino acid transport system substrate-binding protein
LVAGPQLVQAQTAPPKGKIPDTPYKTGHMTFLTGPAAVLGEPSLKGHTLAAEEINAQGGLLGKRKIETVTADEQAGTDANVKELRRMKLEGKIDLFTGIISSGNTPALGPVAEEMSLLTIFVDGCTDFLFDKAVPQPKYTFRLTNIQSADGITAAIGAAQAWPQARKIAHLHPTTATGATPPSTSRSRSSGCCRAPRPCPKAGPSSAPPTSPRTSPRSSRPIRICCSPRCGAAITWPGTSRRSATACSRR